jgi:undecaprenyl-diphosphatase
MPRRAGGCGALWRRRQLSTERFALGLALALGLAVYATGLLARLPNPERAIEDIATALGAWTYALVGVLAFLETGAFVGLVAPGESVVIVGGVIAGQGEIDVVPLIGLVWTCAVLGDTTSFLIGRRVGRGFLLKHGPRLKITRGRLERVEGYFQRHGGKTILIGRFIGLVRALAPFIAGSSRMPYLRFIPYSVVGTGLWATVFCLLGFIFYRSFAEVTAIAGRATLAFGLVVATIVGSVYAYRRLRHEEERRKLAEWLRGAGRCSARSRSSCGLSGGARFDPPGGSQVRGSASSPDASRRGTSESSSPRCWRSPPPASTCSCCTSWCSTATWERHRPTRSCSTCRGTCARGPPSTSPKW